jgi:FG-GAP-like repeat
MCGLVASVGTSEHGIHVAECSLPGDHWHVRDIRTATGVVVALLVPVCAALAVVAAPNPPKYGQPRLALATDISDHGSPRIEHSADFNGDGYIDVVLVRAHWPTFDTYPMQIFLNNRRGGFYDGTSPMFEGAPPRVQFPRELVIADFNRDGRPDVFVADHGYDASPGPGYQNTLVLSTPAGKLRDATSNLPQRSDFTHSATAADVNGDGAVDLYVGNQYTEAQKIPPEILLNDGTGQFRSCADCLPELLRSKITVPWHPRPLDGPTYSASEFVDVNGDGTPDLVLAGNGYYRVGSEGIVSSDHQVLLNDGTGHFGIATGALPPRPFDNTGYGMDVRAADLNRDGKPDLLFAYTKMEPYGAGRWIQILINNGDGTFRDETSARLPQSDSNEPTEIKYLQLVDLNGDGAKDIFGQLVEGAKDPPPVYLNDGRGSFRSLPTGYGRTVDNVFTVIDARGSGARDLFTTSTYSYPRAPSYVVPQQGTKLRPGIPVVPSVARGSAGLVLSWPYEWSATRYEVWHARSPGGKRTRLVTTRLMRFVDRSGSVASIYWLRAVNPAGTSVFSAPVTAR